MTIIFTPPQVRAACGLLGWNASDLASKINVSKQMVSSYFSGKSNLSTQNTEKIAYYLDLEGIEFTSDEGIKRKSLNTKTYKGKSGFVEFMNLVYETARDQGGEFCVSNVDETIFTQRMGEEADADYTKRMKKVAGNFSFKILIKEGDTNFIASDYAEYRCVPQEQFYNVPFYVFGENLAFLIFDKETTVHLIRDSEIANAQRTQFNLAWKGAQKTNVNEYAQSK